MSKIRLIGRNISFRIISYAVTIVISFFLFPFIVRHVGKEVYGVYLVVMTVTGYFGLLDLGVMSALTKYVSEYNGKGDMKTINKIINASFSFYILIGVVIAFLMFICSLYFHHFFKIDTSNIKITNQLFIVACISALFVWPLNTFHGTIQGLNLWNIDATVNIFTQIFNFLAAIVLLSSGYGIVHLFIASQTLTVFGSLVLYYIAKKKSNFKIIFPYVKIETFKFIFNFSFFMFLSSLISIFIFQIHNIIIGYFISMSAVTIYAVAFNIQKCFRAINSTIGAPPWTIASEMEGQKDYEGQKRLLFTGTKYMSAVLLPVIFMMLIFVEPFIIYWMGPDFHESIFPARIIILFWLFNGTSELATGMLTAKGIVKEVVFIQFAIAVLNVAIGISLIKILGITAMALGLTLSMIFVGFPLFLRLSLRSLNVSFKEYFDKSIKRNFWLYSFVIVLSLIVFKYLYPSNLYFTLFELLVIYLVSLGIYYSIMLSKDEKVEIRKLIGVEGIFGKAALVREESKI